MTTAMRTVRNYVFEHGGIAHYAYLVGPVIIFAACVVAISLPFWLNVYILCGLFALIVLSMAKVPGIIVLMISVLYSYVFFPNGSLAMILFYNIIFGLMILYYLLCCFVSTSRSATMGSHHVVASLLVIFATIALISSVLNARFNDRALMEVIRYCSLVFLFLIFSYFINSTRMVKKVLLFILTFSFFVACYSYLLLLKMGLKGFLVFGISSFHGVYSFFGNANSLAMNISYAMPVVLAYVMFNKDKRKKIRAAVLFLFLFAVWFLCNSRSSYVYLFFSVLFLVLFHKYRRKYLALVLTIIIVGWLSVSQVQIVRDLLRLEAGLSLRDQLWKTAVEMIKARPLIGLGPGSYDEMKFYFMVPSIARDLAGTTVGGAAHNLYLTKTAELGIFATLTLIALLIFTFRTFVKMERMMRLNPYYFLYLGSGAVIFGLVFRSFFEIGNLIGSARINENILTLAFLALIFKLPELNFAGNGRGSVSEAG